MKKFADYITSNPKIILGCFILLSLAALYPALKIRTNFNLENFFPQNDPVINDYQHLEEEFGRDDNVIIVGFKNDSLFTSSVLGDLKVITDSTAVIPNVADVQSLWSATDVQNKNQKLTFAHYLKSGSLSRQQLDSIKKAITNDPFADGFLINDSANATAFYITIEKGENNYASRQQIIHHLTDILQPYESKYDFKISGIPYYRNQYVSYLNHEMIFYVTLSSLLIIALLWGLYRSFTGVAIPIAIVWMTILFTLAVMQLTGGYFEVMTSTLAPILLCVGIADSIHMISKYDDARMSLNRRQSIKEMLATLGNATFLTSITTAIGFGTLLTSNIVPMKRFGLYTAIGVMIAFAVTILLLPALLSILKTKHIFKENSALIFKKFHPVLKFISRVNKCYYKKIIVVSFLLSAVIGSGLYFLKVNGKVFDELSEETEPIQDARFFEQNLTPPYPMEFIIDTGTKNGVTSPKMVQKLERFTAFLETYDEIDRVTSLNTLVKEIHHVMAPAKAQLHPIPRSEALISQYMLLFEMNRDDVLKRLTDFSYQKARVAAQVYDVGSYRIHQIKDQITDYINDHFNEAKVTITGSTILSASLNSKIVTSLFKSIALAFILISILMASLFRNIRMVFISLVPNILPLIITAGFMGYMGIDIKSSTAVIFTIAFGIAVDDSIHYMARVRVEMRRGKTLLQALPHATLMTGKAIIITSLVLIAGFGSLLTSVFTSTFYMGLLVGITVITALLADLFLLPSLFYCIKPDINFGKAEAEPFSKSDHEPDQPAALHQ